MPNTAKATNISAAKPNAAARPAASTSQVEAAGNKGAKTAQKERAPAFPLAAKITVVSDKNPKRVGTKAHTKWGYYDGCKTVEDVVEAFKKHKLPRRKAMSAIRWDSTHGHITVEAPKA